MEQLMERGIDWVATSGLSLAYALVILILGMWIAKFLTRMTRRALHKKEVETTLVEFERISSMPFWWSL